MPVSRIKRRRYFSPTHIPLPQFEVGEPTPAPDQCRISGLRRRVERPMGLDEQIADGVYRQGSDQEVMRDELEALGCRV